MTNLQNLKDTEEKNTALTFEEYQSIREPAVNVIINDFAQKYIEKAKERGETVTIDEAREIARREIPSTFVPEWMKNLRVSANIAGTELIYLERVVSELSEIQDLLRIIGEDKIEAYIKKHSNDFKRLREASEAKGAK